MTVTLIQAPAAGGKTFACLERIRAFRETEPVAPVRVVVPDVIHVGAFRRALARSGGALGVQLGTFDDLYLALLARVRAPRPIAPEPVIVRLVSAAVRQRLAAGSLDHYAAIAHKPGFVAALADLLAELKRARLRPAPFRAAVAAAGPRLWELADLFASYETLLDQSGWIDPSGLALAALQALAASPDLGTDALLLIVDGFDEFDRARLAVLARLAGRARELLITLTTDPQGPDRLPFRRSVRTWAALQDALPRLSVETLPNVARRPAALLQLSGHLFEQDAPKHPPGPHVQFIAARDQAHEAREALRWLKARIRRDGVAPRECAVLARDLSPYVPALEAAAHEFGLPVRFAGGRPLAQNPAVAAILTLLELPLRDWAWRPTVDTVRSPYVDLSAYGLGEQAADELAAAARHGVIVGGLDQWTEVLTRSAAHTPDTDDQPFEDDRWRPPALPSGARAAELLAALSAFAARLAPPQTASVADHVTWIEGLLGPQALDVAARLESADPELTLRDLSAWEAWRTGLRLLLLSDQVLPQPALRYEEFFQQLRSAVEAGRYYPGGQQEDRIQLAELSQGRAAHFQALAVLGLAEGLFPAPLHEDPFISDEERIALALPLEPRLRSDQPGDFYTAVTRADSYLLLTRPYLTDSGDSWEPSPYWDEATRLCELPAGAGRPPEPVSFTAAASRVELLTLAARAGELPLGFASAFGDEFARLLDESQLLAVRLGPAAAGEYEGDLAALSAALTQRFGADYLWSPSGLERFGACGFWFYTSTVLGLEEREEPGVGYDVAQRGAMLHEILELVYQRAANSADPDSVLAALPGVAGEVFAAAPEKYQFRATALWAQQQAELIAALEATIRKLAEESPTYKPRAYEARFGIKDNPPLQLQTDAGVVQLRGLIDRIDQDEQGQVRIVDYKTGTSALHNKALTDGTKLQLALYALAAERALGYGTPVEGLYWNILKAEPAQLRLSKFRYKTADGVEREGTAEALALAQQHAGRHVQQARSGAFQPVAPKDGCPHYCPARAFCWRYTPRDW